MKRVQRVRRDRIHRVLRPLGIVFALGALSGAAITWRLMAFDAGVPNIAARPIESVRTPELSRPLEPPRVVPSVLSERPVERNEAVQVSAAVEIPLSDVVEILRDRDLTIPVDDVDDDDLRDTFSDVRTGHLHEAIDIMAPRHTEVRAVEDGTIAKLFNSRGGGGITIYQFDPTGTFCYYYAHLHGYAPGLREGQSVERGQTIGYVGSTGNASPDAPHLHFAIFRLTPERQWWKGQPINPYPVFR